MKLSLAILTLSIPLVAPTDLGAAENNPITVAAEIDRQLARAWKDASIEPARPIDDAEFFRRGSLTITGRAPMPGALTAFVLDPDPAKRAAAVREWTESKDFAQNWARYWRDAIFYRAQEPRALIASPLLESWLQSKFEADSSWGEIATEIITATGPVGEPGPTGLIFAQAGQPEEVAAETSRLFLGIQLQCAQCHDHPYDSWSREQFHELAAFFPRARLRRDGPQGPLGFAIVSTEVPKSNGRKAMRPEQFVRRFDTNKDGKVSKDEATGDYRAVFTRAVNTVDRNKDGALSLKEVEQFAIYLARRRGPAEHRMPDLENPQRPGKVMNPKFFLEDKSPGTSKGDLERRKALARYVTSTENPWFARAYVNRIWSELVGRGFVEPIDDLGPERDVPFAQVFDTLSTGFAKSGYSTRWLVRTITATRAFQNAARPGDEKAETHFAAFASKRMRSDAFLDALVTALGIPAAAPSQARQARAGRRAFDTLFGYDPSAPRDELGGTIPQALFLMNSPTVENGISERGPILGPLLRSKRDDREILTELYLRVLARFPKDKELKTCAEYIAASERRNDALEDIFWCLVNSAEFGTN
ncbi:MAG: DUF1549 domain-containing protein [Planctomycetota bacterium]